jgi:large subunit ribosomal protein L24
MKKEQNQCKKIRKGDKVIAISGNNRGQSGVVLSVRGDKAIVQGLNVRKKNLKKSETHPQGAIIDLEKPIHLSNLQNCTADNAPIKLKVRVGQDGERELYYTIDGQSILYRSLKKQNT